MEENNPVLQKITLIEKKLDKILNMQTKIAKALHLLPVSEKEERDLQVLQRKNLAQAAEVNNTLNILTNTKDKDKLVFETPREIYGDILGDEFLEGLEGLNNG